jgi:hypothetical protein
MTPSSENPVPHRLVPELPLPPYAFIPGRTPHPVSDPIGHSFGAAPLPAHSLDTARWQASKAYLFGIDLFNAGYYWESHVEWESLWLACGRHGLVAEFLKGLIHLAAAGVKQLEGRPQGVKSHASRSALHLQKVAASLVENHFLGLHLGDLIVLDEAICRGGWPAEPVLLMPTLPQS